MFILHSSNKTENLLIHLTSVIESLPLSNPLSKETFLIQSQGMERWLSQQLANYFAVWGNYEFLFPGKFFSSLAEKIDSQFDDAIFDRELMLWKFELLLRNLDDDCFKLLVQYVSGENQDLKRFQLAQRLTQTFDQYQMMRPDMLAKWQQGQLLYNTNSESWQRILWHKIVKDNNFKHRGSLWQAVINKLNQANENQFSCKLPERVFVFGLNTLAPLFLDYLQALSRHCDIHLFLLNPAQVYWADLANKKQLNDSALESHPLLSTLGQQGREFQQMLLEQANFTIEPESFELQEATNNLQRLQNDILNNQVAANQSVENDHSISIHSCHSRMREVEVLKNQLLFFLEQDPELQLREIVVMAPDIQQYTPYISAVFSDIQHAIADRSLRQDNTLLDIFIRFLKLSQSRFGWQSVMDLLEQPLVYSNFALSETDLELIQHWVSQTNIRWGKSATHKQELGLPELDQNTWQAALDRLLMGYAVISENNFVDNVLPYSEIEGSSALVLGGLNDFIQLLFKASDKLKQPCSLSRWCHRFYTLADQLFSVQTQNEQNQRQQLFELLTDLDTNVAEMHTEEVALDVVIAWLESRLSESKSSNGFLRGQLTFCSMLPMRSIPFKVIALLGLNEGEFPKIDSFPSFDLIGQNFRQGDRSRRADDRYQFLEVLLSARKQLIITYIGQSIQHNEEIPPSVVISELLDVLKDYYKLKETIVKHPLQAFSYRNFTGDTNLFSFSATDYQTALALQTESFKTESWWQGKLESEKLEIINISDLFLFFRHPQQHFLQQQFGIRLSGLSADAEEREAFSLDKLEAYGINQQWIDQLLNNQPYPLKNLQAQGRWISGTAGELAFSQQQQIINEFVERIKQQDLGPKKSNITIDIVIGEVRLIGNLSQIYEQGCLLYRYADLKGKDFMQAWLQHLILNQLQATNTHLLSKDETLVFNASDEQSNSLEKLVELYRLGQQHPNTFFTESSFEYVKQALKLKKSTRSKKPALNMAEEQFIKEMAYEPSLQQLYQSDEDLSEVLNHEFEQLCVNLILPIWESVMK